MLARYIFETAVFTVCLIAGDETHQRDSGVQERLHHAKVLRRTGRQKE